jgi:hypothetical protein
MSLLVWNKRRRAKEPGGDESSTQTQASRSSPVTTGTVAKFVCLVCSCSSGAVFMESIEMESCT